MRCIDCDSSTWQENLLRLRELLGAPTNPLLFPYHFLQVVFPKIGGRVLKVSEDGKELAYAFLFPRGLREGRSEFTARLHRVPGAEDLDLAALVSRMRASLPGTDLVLYDPQKSQAFEKSGFMEKDGIEIGRPGERSGSSRAPSRRRA